MSKEFDDHLKKFNNDKEFIDGKLSKLERMKAELDAKLRQNDRDIEAAISDFDGAFSDYIELDQKERVQSEKRKKARKDLSNILDRVDDRKNKAGKRIKKTIQNYQQIIK